MGMFDGIPFFGKSRRTQEQTTTGLYYQQEIRILQGHTGAVTHILKYSADKIVTGGEDGLLIMWDSKTGAKILDLGRHKSPISSLLVLDHLRILSGSDNGEIGIWALSTEKRAIFFGHNSSVSHLIPLPNFHILEQKGDHQDRKLFCSGSNDAFLKVWDVSSGARVLRITRLEGEVPLNSMIAISDSRIVCATDNPELIVYDVAKGSSDRCRGHHRGVTKLLNLPGRLFVSSSLDGTAYIWQAGPSEPVYAIRVLVNLGAPIHSMSLLGKKYIGIPVPKGFEIFHIDTGRVVQGVSRNPSARTDVKGLIPLFGGQQVLTWGKDESELVVWESDKLRDLSTQTLDRLPKKLEMDNFTTLYGHDGSVRCITSLDAVSFATGGADGYVLLWTDSREANRRTNSFAAKSLSYHHLKLRKQGMRKRVRSKKRDCVWEEEPAEEEGQNACIWDMVTASRGTPAFSRFASLFDNSVGNVGNNNNPSGDIDTAAFVNRRKLSDSSLRSSTSLPPPSPSSIPPSPSSSPFPSPSLLPSSSSSSSSIPPSLPSTPPLTASGGREGMTYRRSKSLSTATPNLQPSHPSDGLEARAISLILGQELYQGLLHQPVCGLCNGTEEANMVTSKTKEAIRLLREKNMPDSKIKDVFRHILHHRQGYMIFLDLYLKESEKK